MPERKSKTVKKKRRKGNEQKQRAYFVCRVVCVASVFFFFSGVKQEERVKLPSGYPGKRSLSLSLSLRVNLAASRLILLKDRLNGLHQLLPRLYARLSVCAGVRERATDIKR